MLPVGDVRVLVLAAGASRRMRGRDKLLEPVQGVPLLRRQAMVALAAVHSVLVTLPPDRPSRLAALNGLSVDTATLPDASEGMAASIRHGARWAAGAAGLMILPADMPDLDAADLALILAQHDSTPEAIIRGATSDGRPGHPVLFPADLLAELATLTGDEGARSVLARHRGRVRLVALPGDHALTDLDTPEAWALWRAAQQK